MLLSQGKDPSNFSDSDFSAAIDKLKSAVSSGQIRQFTGNDYAKGLAAGDIAACIAWSGDVFQLQTDSPDIQFVIPDAGAMLWSDNMMIPIGSDHQSNAEAAMNFFYDPTVAATVEDYVDYICPVQGAQDAMKTIDPDLVDSQLIFPDDATLAKTHIFMGLDETQLKKYTDMFTAVTGA
jgi:spermidine/putrescine transport system substrate-binding protein